MRERLQGCPTSLRRRMCRWCPALDHKNERAMSAATGEQLLESEISLTLLLQSLLQPLLQFCSHSGVVQEHQSWGTYDLWRRRASTTSVPGTCICWTLAESRKSSLQTQPLPSPRQPATKDQAGIICYKVQTNEMESLFKERLCKKAACEDAKQFPAKARAKGHPSNAIPRRKDLEASHSSCRECAKRSHVLQCCSRSIRDQGHPRSSPTLLLVRPGSVSVHGA